MILLTRTGERASTNFYTGQCINSGISNGLYEHLLAGEQWAYFASTNSVQICIASREHVKKYIWREARTL